MRPSGCHTPQQSKAYGARGTALHLSTHLPPLTIAVSCRGKRVTAVCDQLRAVDKQRLVNPAGTLALHDLMDLDSALKQVLALR